jgi:hypothetical protein
MRTEVLIDGNVASAAIGVLLAVYLLLSIAVGIRQIRRK